MTQRILSIADKFVVLILFCVTLAIGIHRTEFSRMERVIWSDGEGYFMYLPATFIYGDWTQWDGKDGLHMIACCGLDEQRKVQTRYTYGVSALQAPFFLLAHTYASVFQGPNSKPPIAVQTDNSWAEQQVQRRFTEKRGQATGFSSIYGLAATFGAAFYLALGLWFLKNVLKRHFSTITALATILLVFFATNLYYYTTREILMSHVYSFALFAAFIYFLPTWLEDRNWKKSLLLGLIMALIFLIRPTNLAIALLIPFWEVYDFKSLKSRLGLLARSWPQFLIFVGIVVLIMIPQMMYWKMAFGKYLSWSYGKEGFDYWAKPKILQVLFSPQNGLFAYTPIMLVSMLGIILAWKKRMVSSPGIAIIFAVATYTFASWWAWWFGGAFGHRCYVEFFAMLAIPLGFVIEKVVQSRLKSMQILGLFAFFGFIILNIRLVNIYLPPWDGPDWGFDDYWERILIAAHFW